MSELQQLRHAAKKLAFEIKQQKIKLRTDKTLTNNDMSYIQSKLSSNKEKYRSMMILTAWFKGRPLLFVEPFSLVIPQLDGWKLLYADKYKLQRWEQRRASKEGAMYLSEKYFFPTVPQEYKDWLNAERVLPSNG